MRSPAPLESIANFRMRIGITYTASQSIFSSGRGQTAINLAKALESPGTIIDFIRISSSEQERLWWDDVPQLPNIKVKVEDISATPYEVLIDVDGFVSEAERKRIAQYCIVFYRKTFIINEIENALREIEMFLYRRMDKAYMFGSKEDEGL